MSTIKSSELADAADKLAVYDVVQGAWEHEGEGFEVNARHVLFHLVKDITAKDFSSSEVAQSQISPDCVQYGLRLMRWTDQDATMALPIGEQHNATTHLSSQPSFRSVPMPQIAHIHAASTLAKQLHNEDHESARIVAGTNRLSAARNAGRLLVFAAELQAEEFEFDLFEAFDVRLANLRERFSIPEPDAIS